ncbi:general substrate transporter [Tricholoma matsutake]|nr:general substrate transporter [Tricholoma matsutake 945]
MITQAMGLRLASPSEWRIVLFFSFVISAAQVLFSVFVVESPAWLGRNGQLDKKKAAAKRLWGSDLPSQRNEDDPLLDELEARREATPVNVVTVPQLLAARELWKPLAIISLAMASQQLSGINAVLYYSNNILSKSFPDLGPYISLGVTVVNVLMTFPPIILIERMGRRQLLVISTIGAVLSLWGVGYGLNHGLVTLSSIAILTFVM